MKGPTFLLSLAVAIHHYTSLVLYYSFSTYLCIVAAG
jgi:hypothetical protein